MIRLIKNELFKLFHKFSTYVVLIIAFAFVILVNVIYKYYDDVNYEYYEEINISAAHEYVNNFDPETGDLYNYAYNLALIDCYNLAREYNVTSWQYEAFMNTYLNLDTEYYYEQHSENPDQTKIDELNSQMLSLLQAIYNDDWQYIASRQKEELESEIAYYEELLTNNTFSDNEEVEYQKNLFMLNEELELVNYRLTEDVAYGDDFLNQAIEDIENDLYSIAEYKYGEVNNDLYEETMKDYYENKYILEEKIDTKSGNTLRSVIIEFFSEYSFIILLFVILVAGSIVSEEFNKGTIKSLLTVPHERTSILWSKYITVLLSIIFIVVFLFLCELLVGGILLGFDSLSIPAVVYNLSTNSVEVFNLFSYFLIMFVANLPEIILLATLAFACSTILNSTGFAITITFCGIFASQFINSFAYSFDIAWLDYFVTTNWDFTVYLFGGTSPFGLTIGHSLLVCLTYLVIMLVVTFIVFMRKDIKNI